MVRLMIDTFLRLHSPRDIVHKDAQVTHVYFSNMYVDGHYANVIIFDQKPDTPLLLDGALVQLTGWCSVSHDVVVAKNPALVSIPESEVGKLQRVVVTASESNKLEDFSGVGSAPQMSIPDNALFRDSLEQQIAESAVKRELGMIFPLLSG